MPISPSVLTDSQQDQKQYFADYGCALWYQYSERYVWQDQKLIQVRQADHNFVNKTWQHYYLYEPNSHAPIALYDRDTGVQDIETDHLGTPISVYQHDTGETLWAGDFETYGKRKCQKAANQEDSSGQYDPKLRFQGQYEDKETGLYQNLHRYYDPHAGRYITHDPIGLYGGLNAYQYCPNPVEWIDPLGLSCKDCPDTKSEKNKKTTYWAESRRDAFRQAKRDANIGAGQKPLVEHVDLLDGYGKKVLDDQGLPVQAREYHFKNIKGVSVVIQEHSLGHRKAALGHGLEPHFNVRRVDELTGEVLNTSSFPNTHGHYNF
ncbi:RHS repeat-associated core domain-containing protein [Marinomonas mediterranea]|uniref:RHS repeat-associated core domain n=1 Tax=Marinomonas mediterranea (strain ATCC 700492 / JCM 21426 / NBRC 103028 / MMB-1) TaxID=717774 RepID=F2JTT7_MARM1|nr:RHS repeat-associated core domain-containing protein [Marinomonas mediterranea]ADZ92707.1 RHS repeat-associated core domain [Marinomonas mediterranea MMB-1]WCN10641.1 hypothetical protein GV055_17770 [Marinomonas mediterranea]WCN18737.1 hypothetical protein GV053_17670 [Marinomonas mediterranea MMB-1]